MVVCARNEAARLAARLPSVLEQAYPSFEVIVVDHASSDGTQAVLQELARQHPQLRVLQCSDPRPGKKQA
ncbi:glycosyltransferase, partial [Arthrospira platensis SPKY1]|nr:glycosyltransferase [Arthrospira platensis SPKY1]